MNSAHAGVLKRLPIRLVAHVSAVGRCLSQNGVQSVPFSPVLRFTQGTETRNRAESVQLSGYSQRCCILVVPHEVDENPSGAGYVVVALGSESGLDGFPYRFPPCVVLTVCIRIGGRESGEEIGGAVDCDVVLCASCHCCFPCALMISDR